MTDLTLCRLERTLERRGRSRSQHYREIATGLMTPPVRLGERLAAWPSHEIESLNRAEIAGATPDEIRQLVQQLVAQRAQMREHPLEAA